ncbi:MAG: HDOD domain-containing protein [Planctomycetota bacterium]
MTAAKESRVNHGLMPLPDMVRRIFYIVTDPSSSADELLAVLRAEPVLTRGVLRLSNSSIHSVPRQIEDVSQTVAYLGTGNLIRMVIAQCVIPYYRRAERALGSVREPWRHALAVGIAAQLLAEASGAVEPSTAFAAGVLHDIGKLTARPIDRADLPRVDDDGDQRSFLEVEREILGQDHAIAGAQAAEHWGLPHSLCQAIRNHHHPDFVAVDHELTAIVHIADVMAMQCGIGLAIEGLTYPTFPEPIRRIHLRERELDVIRLRLLEELRRAHDLVKLATPHGR